MKIYKNRAIVTKERITEGSTILYLGYVGMGGVIGIVYGVLAVFGVI